MVDDAEKVGLEAENRKLRAMLLAILQADERGQGQPFMEAMDAAHYFLRGSSLE